MDLPVNPPVRPMLAKLAHDLPPAGDFLYEPKWDGFRGIVFRDGDEIEIGSRNERPLTRYFPELVEGLREALPPRCVVDGEIVIVGPDGLDFDALQLRIHPAESRVTMLSKEMPSSFVAFDLLALGDTDLRGEPLSARRAELEKALGASPAPVRLTPATPDRDVAADWFDRFEGAGLDGVVAKRLDGTYRENERAMVKIKHVRTADCVVAGFRWHKSGGIVGSLLLGVYGDSGVLHHVGITASFTMARRKELVDELAPYRKNAERDHPWPWAEPRRPMRSGSRTGDGETDEASEGLRGEPEGTHTEATAGRVPGAKSRWNAGKDLSFEPLRPELVCEVAYDHLQGDRFRHATTFQRWRPDREPSSCTYTQFAVAAPHEVAAIFGAR